jgi:hypothetical protein
VLSLEQEDVVEVFLNVVVQKEAVVVEEVIYAVPCV